MSSYHGGIVTWVLALYFALMCFVIRGLLPIRLAQPRTTSCGWIVGVTRSGRAETGTPPPVPAGGRGGPSRQPARHEATAAALLGREAVLHPARRAGSRVEPRHERQRARHNIWSQLSQPDRHYALYGKPAGSWERSGL